MAFEVTKWGYSPDERTVGFGLIGFAFGALPPWQWLMSTTDAEPPYEILNSGVLWHPGPGDSIHPTDVRYSNVTPMPGVDGRTFRFDGTEVPSGGVSMTFTCSFFAPAHPDHTEGEITELFQNALAERSFNMIGGGTGAGLIPNPLVITPKKWNFEL